MKKLVVFLVAVALVTSAPAATMVWENYTADGQWSNAANWYNADSGAVALSAPGSSDTANYGGTGTCVINSNVSISSFYTAVRPGSSNSIVIDNGGYLNVVGSTPIIGHPTTAENTTLTINAGGTLNANNAPGSQLNLGQNNGNSIVNINGGTLLANVLYVTVSGGNQAVVNLNSGTIVNNSIHFGTFKQLIDIDAGTLYTKYDVATCNAWAGAGLFTGYGVAGLYGSGGNLVVEGSKFYNGSFYTKVTAVPEPMTMALLGLGGLLLRKKK